LRPARSQRHLIPPTRNSFFFFSFIVAGWSGVAPFLARHDACLSVHEQQVNVTALWVLLVEHVTIGRVDVAMSARMDEAAVRGAGAVVRQ
jgi:hypothetical protein